MKVRNLVWVAVASIAICHACVSIIFGDEPIKSEAAQEVGDEPIGGVKLSIDVARDRAKVMQDVYLATLRMLHQRYFHQDKKVLPARAMQDIFADVENQSNVQARWISASLKPMSIDHTPDTAFEKNAAKEIAAGSSHLEVVEGGFYRRAIAVPLTGGCLHCHEGMFQTNKRKHFAGLVVSIPLQDEVTETTP